MNQLFTLKGRFIDAVKQVYDGSYNAKMCEAYLKCCPYCVNLQIFPSTRAGSKPIIHLGTWSAVQMDLIDFTKQPDGDWRYVLSTKCHFSRFAILKPVKTKTHEEIATNLLQIFSIFRLPNLIHTDNGGEFFNVANHPSNINAAEKVSTE